MNCDKHTLNSEEPKSFNTPGRATLSDSDIGNVGLAVLTLAKELWVMRDRMAVFEAVLDKKGIDVSQEIENFQPDPNMQSDLDRQANVLVEKLLSTLKGS